MLVKCSILHLVKLLLWKNPLIRPTFAKQSIKCGTVLLYWPWKLHSTFIQSMYSRTIPNSSTHMSTESICVFLQQISEMETQYEVIYMKIIFSVMYEGRGYYAGLHFSFFSTMIVLTCRKSESVRWKFYLWLCRSARPLREGEITCFFPTLWKIAKLVCRPVWAT